MFLDLISLTILYVVIIGFSAFFKFNFLNLKNVKLYNIDFFYGVFFLCLIGIIFNFFVPLKFVTPIIYLLGVYFFIKFNIKKK